LSAAIHSKGAAKKFSLGIQTCWPDKVRPDIGTANATGETETNNQHQIHLLHHNHLLYLSTRIHKATTISTVIAATPAPSEPSLLAAASTPADHQNKVVTIDTATSATGSRTSWQEFTKSLYYLGEKTTD
jgi:hypothetical protein